MNPRRSSASGDCDRLPLTMPAELWLKLAPEKRVVFASAQAILDDLGQADSVPLIDLCERLGRTPSELLAPLRLLHALELIAVGPGATLRVIALPAEPVHVQGPDGRWRWIFVKQRLLRDADLARAVFN